MSTGEVTVRRGCGADLAEVIALERGIAEAPHWAVAEYGLLVAAGEAGTIRRCLMVAELGGSLVGFAVGKVVDLGRDAVGELESVAVAGEVRRSGVGRALCEAVVEWCRARGATAMELEVRAGSGGAIALYRELGFVEVGRRRGYYREPVEDALLMGLKLAG